MPTLNSPPQHHTLLLTFLIFFGLTFVSCSSPPPAPTTQTATAPAKRVGLVGVNGGDWIAVIHLSNLLANHGIDGRCEGGSIVYGFTVPEKDYDKSIAIIKQDWGKCPYSILIQATWLTVPESAWTTLSPNALYDELLKLPQYAPDTDLGAALRCKEFAENASTFRYVKEIKLYKRTYLNNGPQIGHDFEITSVVSLDEDIAEKTIDMQVGDHSRQIDTHGGTESWHGSESIPAQNRKKYDHREKSPWSEIDNPK